MTLDEATAIFKIMSSADGACETCALDLFDQFTEIFPQFKYQVEGGWFDDNCIIWLKQKGSPGKIGIVGPYSN
jgi:hypothetical protein